MTDTNWNDLTIVEQTMLEHMPDGWVDRHSLPLYSYVYVGQLSHLVQLGLVEYVQYGPDDYQYRRTPAGKLTANSSAGER